MLKARALVAAIDQQTFVKPTSEEVFRVVVHLRVWKALDQFRVVDLFAHVPPVSRRRTAASVSDL
jgi:hypothetical protein